MGLSISVCVRVGTSLGAADTVQAQRSAASGVLCTGGGVLSRGRGLGKLGVKGLAGEAWVLAAGLAVGQPGSFHRPHLRQAQSGPGSHPRL